jgi:hypothetical protein
MEPQNTQITQRAGVPDRARTMRSISRSQQCIPQTPSYSAEPLKETSSQRVEHRQGVAMIRLYRRFAGIHLRILRVLRFHFSCLLPEQPC